SSKFPSAIPAARMPRARRSIGRTAWLHSGTSPSTTFCHDRVAPHVARERARAAGAVRVGRRSLEPIHLRRPVHHRTERPCPPCGSLVAPFRQFVLAARI